MNNFSWTIILAAASGGALGASLRLITSYLLKDSHLPWGTFVVNLTGCYLIGLLSGIIINNYPESPNLKIFVITGMLGSFTTFSTFAFEGMELYVQGRYLYFILFTAVQVLIGLLLVIAGRQSVTIFVG